MVDVVPVGKAWQAAWESNGSLPLYASDNHHASKIGALLTAYVFVLHLAPHTELRVHPSFPGIPRFLYHAIFPPKGEVIDEAVNELILEQARAAVSSSSHMDSQLRREPVL